MASILEKLRIITLSNVHGVLDFAINMNDIGALKVYARDLDGAGRQMEQFDNTLLGSIQTLNGDITKAARLAGQWQQDVDTLLSDDDPGNDSHALKIQVDLDATQEDLERMRAKLNDKQQQHALAEKSISQLSAKLTQVVRRIKDLEEAKEETSAMKNGARATENVMRQFDDSRPDVDNVGARIMEQNATARAELNRAMGKASDVASDDRRIASAEAALARRKAELAAQKAQQPA